MREVNLFQLTIIYIIGQGRGSQVNPGLPPPRAPEMNVPGVAHEVDLPTRTIRRGKRAGLEPSLRPE